MQFEMIHFHTHPFQEPINNICSHKEYCNMSADNTRQIYDTQGISKICGSVIGTANGRLSSMWEKIRYNNDTALSVRTA